MCFFCVNLINIFDELEPLMYYNSPVSPPLTVCVSLESSLE